jgi:hypothetical protein
MAAKIPAKEQIALSDKAISLLHALQAYDEDGVFVEKTEPPKESKADKTIVSPVPMGGSLTLSAYKSHLMNLGLHPSVLSAGPDSVHIVRLTRASTFLSGASGTTGILSLTRLSSGYDQSSAYSGLFRECRPVKTVLTIVPIFNAFSYSGMTAYLPAAIGFDPAANAGSTAASNISNVIRFEASKLFNLCSTQTQAIICKYKFPPRPWSLTDATAVGSDPVGAQEGGWNFTIYAPVIGAAGVELAYYSLETWYQVRTYR